MTNMFAAASTAAPKVKKTKANSRKSFVVEGLKELAAISALMETLEGLKATYEAQVKDSSFGIFVDLALETPAKPDAFNLEDGASTGQFQLRKRSQLSPLTDSEVAILTAYGIPVSENVKQEECFKFRSEILADPVLAQEISDTLMANPKLASLELIVKQEAIITKIVADTSIEVACKTLTNKIHMSAALKIAGVQALKTKFESTEMQVALDTIKQAGHDLFAVSA